MPRPAPPEVAYVLKGWPRISELFIASEIYRLEQAGLPLRLYVIKPADEAQTHPVVDRILAPTTYLPATSSLSATTLVRWLRENAGPFLPALRRTARRHPAGLARAAGLALAQSVRARKSRFAWPRKLYVKELLQAIALADELAAAADLVRDKAAGVPVTVARGRSDLVTAADGPGAAALRRDRADDLFR